MVFTGVVKCRKTVYLDVLSHKSCKPTYSVSYVDFLVLYSWSKGSRCALIRSRMPWSKKSVWYSRLLPVTGGTNVFDWSCVTQNYRGTSGGDAPCTKATLLVSANDWISSSSYRLIANDRVYCGEGAAAMAMTSPCFTTAEAFSLSSLHNLSNRTPSST